MKIIRLIEVAGRCLQTVYRKYRHKKCGNPCKSRLPHQRKKARDGTRTRDPNLGKVVLHQLSHSRIIKSGWQDSNLRPPGPKPGALAKLSHTPFLIIPHTLKTTHWKSIHPFLQLTITASLIGFQPISWHWLRQCLKPVKSQPPDASIFRLFLSILPPLPKPFGQALDLLVTVSYTRYRASTSAL